MTASLPLKTRSESGRWDLYPEPCLSGRNTFPNLWHVPVGTASTTEIELPQRPDKPWWPCSEVVLEPRFRRYCRHGKCRLYRNRMRTPLSKLNNTGRCCPTYRKQ